MQLYLLFIIASLMSSHAQTTKPTPKERITVYYENPYPYSFININPHEFINFKDLDSKNTNHIEEIWNHISNLNTAGGTNRARFIQIRGIGERSQYDNTPNTSVGVFLNHIDLSGTPNAVNSNATQSINVYKGPMSSFYGSSALAGNIIFKSKEPDLIEKNTSLNMNLSSFNTRDLNTSFSIPLNLNSAVSIDLRKTKSDHYIKNTYLSKSTNYQNEDSISLRYLYQNKKVNLATSHMYFNQDNGYDVWNFTQHSFKTISDKPGKDDLRLFGNSVELNYKLGDSQTLSFISSHALNKSLYSYDEDWGNNAYWNNIPGWNSDYNYNKSYKRTNNRFHQKITYQKSLKRNLTITGGLHFFNQEEKSNIKSFKDNTLRDQNRTDFKQKNSSLLFGMSKEFKATKVSLNSRIERINLGFKTSKNFNSKMLELNYGLNLNIKHKLNLNHEISLSFAKGYKAGGFNADINLEEKKQSFDAENLYQYEATWLLSNLNTRVNIFFLKRRNQQVKTSFQDDPLDPSSFYIYTDNAAKSQNYGIEIDSSIFKNRLLDIHASIGLLKAKFNEYTREDLNYKGRDQAHSPLYTFSIESKLTLNKNLNLASIIHGKDGFYFSNAHNQKSKPYQLLDIYLDYKLNKKLKMRFWGKNILNKEYALRGFYFANEPPTWQPKLYTQSGPKAHFGINIAYKF